MRKPDSLQKTRHIRSFVRRDSRVTKAQASALEKYFDKYEFHSGDEQLDDFSALNLEIGAGDGQCSLALALASTNKGFIAAEVYRTGLGRLLGAVAEHAISNVRVADIDVVNLLPTIPAGYFDTVMIFFPDPWPKKRHHKRRLLNGDFLDSLAPKLKRSGRLFMATDIEDYALQVLGLVEESKHWRNLAGSCMWAIRPNFRCLTKFEAKGIAAGRGVYEIFACRKD
jgi:tRNA (guanine-N7-)-methyltransferase